MFSEQKSDNIFNVFWLRTWIIYFFFVFVAIVYLIWRQECVGIQYKLIPDSIKLTPSGIVYPIQYRTNVELLLVEVFQNRMD